MHQISSHASPGLTTIEVDGSLTVVSAHDLQLSLGAAVHDGARRVGLDLSRVTDIDDDGVRALMRCCDSAISAGTTLTLTGCSRPSLEALRGFHVRRAQR